MATFEEMDADDHEQVVFCRHRPSGLRAIIALHSTALGPGLGGVRFKPYATEDEALHDVLRLSHGMTYKNAAAGLDLGGGKAVIIGDPRELRSEALFRAYGRFVHGLNGRYLTAEDVGTTIDDMATIRRETPHVTGTATELGGSGDPSPATAIGVLHAMRAVAERLWGSDDLTGRHVVVSGVGKVGGALAGHLAAAGAKVTVADVDADRVRAVAAAIGADVVAPAEAHTIPCDVFAPCALGAVLTSITIPQLRCEAVVGSANNQLGEEADAERLADAGIAYVPDFVANAGGVINIAEELRGYDAGRALHAVGAIRATTTAVLHTAEAEGITTEVAANRIAERRIEAVTGLARIRR
ncbi:MAG: Glutamate dehydrogenase/leucine dehydrogenase [Actinomycetia bacterium]|nr:Glutamate dehydrogenase/leucine dehydrogenase [Actinomycetes bacterium]